MMNNDEKVNYEIKGLFPVPIIVIKFEQHEKYSNLPIMTKKDVRPKSWTVPLNTSYPNIISDDDFISMEKVKELKSDIKTTIDSVFKEINISTDYWIKNFWYNIYHNHQGQEAHNHLGTLIPYWCGIYYNKNPTPTVFCKGQGPHDVHRHQIPDNASSELAPFFTDVADDTFTEGDIILFPPYVEHFVTEQNGIDSDDKMRVTFSFNLMNTDIRVLKEEENNGTTS